jgi:hypothetical protein
MRPGFWPNINFIGELFKYQNLTQAIGKVSEVLNFIFNFPFYDHATEVKCNLKSVISHLNSLSYTTCTQKSAFDLLSVWSNNWCKTVTWT